MIDHFPGPKSYPLFGNVLEWSFEPGNDKRIYLKLVFQYINGILDVAFSIVRKYAKKFKTTYRVWATFIGSVNVITPEDAEVKFRNNV